MMWVCCVIQCEGNMDNVNLMCMQQCGVSELGFNVPPTTRSYGDGTSV